MLTIFSVFWSFVCANYQMLSVYDILLYRIHVLKISLVETRTASKIATKGTYSRNSVPGAKILHSMV